MEKQAELSTSAPGQSQNWLRPGTSHLASVSTSEYILLILLPGYVKKSAQHWSWERGGKEMRGTFHTDVPRTI